ncbi:MAG: hypothetical protein IJ021_03800 [Clostridia bacterium]|nr:hypothetical protein [Clostridia bacterium]
MNKKTFTSVFWGLFIIAIGVILGGNVMGIWDIDLFFHGWWTMFIILPCLYGIIKNGPDVVNVAGLIIGVLLLLDNTEFFGKYISWKLIFPIIIVVIGVNIIISALRKNSDKSPDDVKFGERKVDFGGKEFKGGTFKCTFGELKIDLTGAVIKQEKPFLVECSFGEVTVYLPAGVSLDIKSNTSFGEVKTVYTQQSSGIPLDMKVSCSFGSVTVK